MITWQEAVDCYGDIIRIEAHRLYLRPEDSRDMEQEAFLWLGQNLAVIDGQPERYVRGAIRKTMLAILKADQKRRKSEFSGSVLLDNNDDGPELGTEIDSAPGEHAEICDDREIFMTRCMVTGFEKLSDRQQMIVRAIIFDGVSYKTLADQLGTTPTYIGREFNASLSKIREFASSDFAEVADFLSSPRAPKGALHSSSEGFGGRA